MIEANVVIGNARNSAAAQASESRRASAASSNVDTSSALKSNSSSSASAPAAPPAKRAGASATAAKPSAKKTASSNVALKKLGGGSGESRMSVLDQIKSFVSKPINLRHVDTEEETNKRRAAQRQSEFSRSGIAQGLRAQAERQKEIRLLDSVRLLPYLVQSCWPRLATDRHCSSLQGVTEGRKYWKKDMQHYIDEVNKSFIIDVKFMKILFEILEHAEGVTPFEVPFGKLSDKKVTMAQFAETLNKLGFTLKHRNELHGYEDSMENATKVTVYTQIIAPFDMPVHSIVKTIILAAKKANATN
jgi:hypothetical protein